MTCKLLTGVFFLALCGCGGGGGGTAFIPQPPVQPPPPPQQGASVTIFPNPTVGEFTTVGASAKASNTTNLDAPLGPISTADADQLHVRFTSAGTYEILLPGSEWDELIPSGQGLGSTEIQNTDDNAFLSLSGSKDNGYRYSELASYAAADRIGAFAFGTLTPAGGVPTTGSANYTGTVAGKSDVIASDPYDPPNRAFVVGTVSLKFDFGNGSLAGAMAIGLLDAANGPLQLGTFNFKDTVFGIGSTTYSGKFDTAAAGDNFFLGKFTGPNGEETIGAWALPFVLDVSNQSITADHKTHQAFGAWIAKH